MSRFHRPASGRSRGLLQGNCHRFLSRWQTSRFNAVSRMSETELFRRSYILVVMTQDEATFLMELQTCAEAVSPSQMRCADGAAMLSAGRFCDRMLHAPDAS